VIKGIKTMMNTLADTRRAKLKELVENSSLASVALRLGKPARQLNDMIAGRKHFGDKVARAMELEGELPPYYFDALDKQLRVNDLYTEQAGNQPASTGSENKSETKRHKDVSDNQEEDVFKAQLLYFYEGMSQLHKEALVGMANNLYNIDQPNDKKANPWRANERRSGERLRKSEHVRLGDIQLGEEAMYAGHNEDNGISEQGIDQVPRGMSGAGKKR
jgi:hypothetical protein